MAHDTAGQADVDDIHERLLTVAVEAVSIHGGKDQEEREAAIQHFKAGTKVRPPPSFILIYCGPGWSWFCSWLCSVLCTVHGQCSGCDVRPLFT